jgi:hypothetical protein
MIMVSIITIRFVRKPIGKSGRVYIYIYSVKEEEEEEVSKRRERRTPMLSK